MRLFFFFLFTALSFSEEVVLSDKTGRSLKVRLATFSDGVVGVVAVKNRKKYKMPLSSLDEPSNKIIKKWLEKGGHLSEKYSFTFTSGKSDRSKDAFDYDDRRLLLRPKVTITNDHQAVHSKPVKLVAMVLGKPVLERNKMFIFLKEEYEVASLAPRESLIFKMKTIDTTYDDNNYAKHGSKYRGYALFVIFDGKVIESKYVPSSVGTRYGEALLEGAEGDTL